MVSYYNGLFLKYFSFNYIDFHIAFLLYWLPVMGKEIDDQYLTKLPWIL